MGLVIDVWHDFAVAGPYTFSIGDTSGLTPYIRGGIATQVKMPDTLQFVRLLMHLYIIYIYTPIYTEYLIFSVLSIK